MRANYCEAAPQTLAFALDAVRIKERAVIVGPVKVFGLLLHDAHVRTGNIEPALRIVIGNAFEQRLPRAQRQRNEPVKDDRVSDRQWKHDQQRPKENCHRTTPLLSDKL